MLVICVAVDRIVTSQRCVTRQVTHAGKYTLNLYFQYDHPSKEHALFFGHDYCWNKAAINFAILPRTLEIIQTGYS